MPGCHELFFVVCFLVHVLVFPTGKCVMPWRVVRGLKEFLWSSVESPFWIGRLVLRAVPVVFVFKSSSCLKSYVGKETVIWRMI